VAPATTPSSLRPLCAVPHAGKPRTNTLLVLGAAPRFSPWEPRDRFPSGNGARAARWGWKHRWGHLSGSSRAHAASEPRVVFPSVFHHTRAGHDISKENHAPTRSPNPPGVAFRGAAPLSTGQRRPYGEGWDGCPSGAPFVFLLGPPGLKIDSVTSWDRTQACTPKQRITPRG
jgi:hypothetical protein